MNKALMTSREVGQRLRQMREKAHLTLKQMGARVNLSHSQLSRFESGKQSPTVDQVIAITTAANRPPWAAFFEPPVAIAQNEQEERLLVQFRLLAPVLQQKALDYLNEQAETAVIYRQLLNPANHVSDERVAECMPPPPTPKARHK